MKVIDVIPYGKDQWEMITSEIESLDYDNDAYYP